jgi:hypothetical protein
MCRAGGLLWTEPRPLRPVSQMSLIVMPPRFEGLQGEKISILPRISAVGRIIRVGCRPVTRFLTQLVHNLPYGGSVPVSFPGSQAVQSPTLDEKFLLPLPVIEVHHTTILLYK